MRSTARPQPLHRAPTPSRRGRGLRRPAAAVVVGLSLSLALPASATSPSDGAPAGEVAAADEPGTATLDRRIEDPAVTESSGLARSTYDASLLWTHDDSGDANRVFGVARDGSTRAVLTLAGATARDWEDISNGPGHTLWVGDTGDNARERASIQVHRFVEPSDPRTSTVSATSYDLVYPDGPHDAETVMVHPASGRVHIVTKSPEGGAVYVAPATLSASSPNRLTRVAAAPAGVTAGAFAPDGGSFTLRTHTRSLTYAAIGAEPVAQPLPDLAQGESLEYDATGDRIYVGTEGADSPVYRVVLPQARTTSTSTQTLTTSTATARLSWSPKKPAVPSAGVVRPERYGAKGDGVTDDSAALQRALDTAARNNKKVELTAGRVYRSERRLALPSRTYLYGAGRSSVLKFTWTRYDAEHPSPFITNKDQSGGNTDITMTNFAIRGAWSGLPAGPNSIQSKPLVPAVRFRVVKRFRISRLDVGYAAGISLLNQDSSEGLIANNRVHHSGRDGINTGAGYHVLVRDNLIEKVGDDGIAMLSRLYTGIFSNRVAAVGNTIRGWESNVNGLTIGRGIALIGVRNTVVVGNTVDRTHSDGIKLTPSHTADGSRFWRNAQVTIRANTVIDAGQNYPGTDRRVWEPGHDGIKAVRSDDVRVLYNRIVNPYGRAIYTYDCGCTVRR